MIAIIGGGLAGCCIALELARRNIQSTLFEANQQLMNEASRWNEGKLHLGYVYANDSADKTARAMIEGSLTFRPILQDLLGLDLPSDWFSIPFDYAVPKSSLLSIEAISSHFNAVDKLLSDRSSDWHIAFGDLELAPASTAIDLAMHYNDDLIQAQFATPEIAIDPYRVAEVVTHAVMENDLIDVITQTTVDHVSDQGTAIELRDSENSYLGKWQQVINCSWRSLLHLDHSAGLPRGENWLYRYKSAIHISGVPDLDVPSTTFVLGPYGDIVRFSDGRLYVSWYPACRSAISIGSSHIPNYSGPSEEEAAEILTATLDALNQFVPNLPTSVSNFPCQLAGAWILATGTSDIDQLNSQLHRRDNAGITSHGGYHSLNSGKYCLIPKLARDFVARQFDR